MENVNNPPNGGNDGIPLGESPIYDRIEQLSISLEKVKVAFSNSKKDLINQMGIWFLICLVIILASIYLFCWFFDKKFEEQYWTWQYVYYTAIRITAISGLFYVAAFSFNMLKLAINLYQKNLNKIAIIDSMASFVESGIEKADRALIFNKLIGIVVESDVVSSDKNIESDLKLNIKLLIELLEKMNK